MSENDTIPSLENLEKDKAAWLYFCPWYQRYLTELTGADELKEIYTSDYCITLDELPDWDAYDPELPPQTTTATQTTTAAARTTTTAVLTTTAASSSGKKNPDAMTGDVNCDKIVDVSDAVLLARLLAEDADAKVNEQGMLNADCDGTEGLSSSDTIQILKYIAKLITAEQFGQKP